jgi:hypothetical protein
MQAIWKRRRALVERGAAGRLGRRGLSYLLLLQVALPLCACMVDVYDGLYGVLFLPPAKVAAVWAGFNLLQMGTAAYALHLDRERYGPLWTLPFQQVVYRQLMYLVVIQSTVMALLGGRLRWQRMARIGAVAGDAAEAGARREAFVARVGGGRRKVAGTRSDEIDAEVPDLVREGLDGPLH